MSIPPYKRRRLPMNERIRRSVEIDANGCWIWRLSKSRGGYGRIGLHEPGRMQLKQAHRVSYEAFIGPIPDGLQIDHLCRVRACVNPEHLEPVTAAENTRRKPDHGIPRRSHCVRGHGLEGDNVRINAAGSRHCRTCDQIRNRARYVKKEAVR